MPASCLLVAVAAVVTTAVLGTVSNRTKSASQPSSSRTYRTVLYLRTVPLANTVIGTVIERYHDARARRAKRRLLASGFLAFLIRSLFRQTERQTDSR